MHLPKVHFCAQGSCGAPQEIPAPTHVRAVRQIRLPTESFRFDEIEALKMNMDPGMTTANRKFVLAIDAAQHSR